MSHGAISLHAAEYQIICINLTRYYLFPGSIRPLVKILFLALVRRLTASLQINTKHYDSGRKHEMCASSELPASEYINLEWRATVNRPMLYLSRPRSNRLCQLYAYHACFWFLAAPRDFVCVRVHGRIQNLDLWGELSRAPRRKNKGAPGAESIWG